jgi:ADP-ribose pyrophosphatase YjhB (NUDIX family)
MLRSTITGVRALRQGQTGPEALATVATVGCPVWTPCAGGVLRDDEGRLLLVLRGQEPYAGTWSLPSGRTGRGETARQAAAREVLEETGLVVEVGDLLGVVRRSDPQGLYHYEISDFACRAVGGTLRAGDDAADAAWFTLAQVADLPLAPGLLDALAEFGVLSQPAR